MLARVLETEVMDTAEEADDYDAMDHANVNHAFCMDIVAALRASAAAPKTILDVGTGTARIPIALAALLPSAAIVAIDLAAHMLDRARKNVDHAGLATRIRLLQIDAKLLPLDARFEAVICNSIVHHIPEPASILRAMRQRLAPGGVLFVRDLARPTDLGALNKIVALYSGECPTEAEASARWTRQRALFVASLHAALTVQELQTLADDAGLAGAQIALTSDRHWTLTWRHAP